MIKILANHVSCGWDIVLLTGFFFIKDFDPSSFEAYLFGPKILMPLLDRKSTIPLTNGSSGPTMTVLIPSLFKKT